MRQAYNRSNSVSWPFYIFIFKTEHTSSSTRIVFLWTVSGRANQMANAKYSFSLSCVVYRHISQGFAADWTSVVRTSICLKLNMSKQHLLQP